MQISTAGPGPERKQERKKRAYKGVLFAADVLAVNRCCRGDSGAVDADGLLGR